MNVDNAIIPAHFSTNFEKIVYPVSDGILDSLTEQDFRVNTSMIIAFSKYALKNKFNKTRKNKKIKISLENTIKSHIIGW